MSDVQPTPLYDALAAALRPLSTSGQMTGPLTGAINAAVAAVEAHLGREADEAAPADATVKRLRAEVLALRAQMLVEQERHQADVTAVRSELTPVAPAAQQGDLVEALEAVYVQAKARWDHEGGPVGLRDAIAAVEAAR